MNLLLAAVGIPAVCGLAALVLPNRARRLIELLGVLGSLVALLLAAYLFVGGEAIETTRHIRFDALSRVVFLAVGLFGFLVSLYSQAALAGRPTPANQYYALILWTLAASLATVVVNDLILLLVGWGFLGLTLYLLINISGEDASQAAKKTFIIIGATDSLMLLGIAILWNLTGSVTMSAIQIPLPVRLLLADALPPHLPAGYVLPALAAFLCLAAAAFAKAGVMPLHTWIPDAAEKSLIPVTAFLPASLDKLLGIYLLARLVNGLFEVGYAVNFLLMAVGAVTIIAAVFMAMIQHDLKKLLSYHVVSQAGYMVLGIGTGTAIGLAGSLFHMLNSAIYKSCLFLTAGAVEHRTGTTEMNRLGGLAMAMPLTFISCAIASFSIVGVPLFNGAVSKGMMYQGVIEAGQAGDGWWIVWLVAAMFGNALTMANFMKLIHATFLGRSAVGKPATEVGWSMALPMLALAAICVLFGVFAQALPLKHLIEPITGALSYPGFWLSGLGTIPLGLGLVIGLVIYKPGRPDAVRIATAYTGGETLPPEEWVTGTDFNETIAGLGFFKTLYGLAEAKVFDIYDQGSTIVFAINGILRTAHTGILTHYAVWCRMGLLALMVMIIGVSP